MDFGSHTTKIVEQAVALVNAVVPGDARGRPYPEAADPAELRDRVNTALRPSRPLTADTEIRALTAIAVQLRQVFTRASAGDLDTAAELVNDLIERYDALPRLQRHDGEPWHLHFHRPDATPADGWGGSLAVGLAFILGSEYADRMGVCSAPACDRVYIDTSRNGTKRYCSTACQNRVKTAAFRARKATP